MSKLSIVIDAPINKVWDHLSDIESHASWMEDAVELELISGDANRVGAKYLCKTAVGPLKTDDTMEVIAYEPPTYMEISHVGAVKGSGTFNLIQLDETRTEFVWEENLVFPIYMGGPLGKIIGMKLLHRIWKRNLQNLKFQIEAK